MHVLIVRCVTRRILRGCLDDTIRCIHVNYLSPQFSSIHIFRTSILRKLGGIKQGVKDEWTRALFMSVASPLTLIRLYFDPQGIVSFSFKPRPRKLFVSIIIVLFTFSFPKLYHKVTTTMKDERNVISNKCYVYVTS